MIKFETVSRFENSEINLIPTRKTEASAGYDMYVAEEIVVPSWIDSFIQMDTEEYQPPHTLEEMAKLTKELKCKFTLVSTGVKCQLEPDTYLELSVRSSTPLKYWLVLANSVGVIDESYCGDNDQWFMAVYATKDAVIQRNDRICQFRIMKKQPRLAFMEVDHLKDIDRGGCGSTGVN